MLDRSMSAIGPVRPHFTLRLPGPREERIEQLRTALLPRTSDCVFRVVTHHVDVSVPREMRHRWSPWISLEFLPETPEETRVNGIIGPHPSIWTFFAFSAIGNAVLTSLGLVIGFVQWSLGSTPWGFLILGLGLLIYATLYGASQAGRRLADPQTRTLLKLLEEAFGARIE